MKKFTIAWMPGDGVGNELLLLAKKVLNTLNFSATYLPCDIGWNNWINGGNPLPFRTIENLKKSDCGFLGAVTSKPKEEALRELNPSLQNKGYEYRSPILQLRQKFNLHTNFRPCISFEGNQKNHTDGIDLAIFRENTEGMYSGVEFYPIPDSVFDILEKESAKMKKFRFEKKDDIALSTRILTRTACESILLKAFEFAVENKRKSVTLVDKPNVLRETGSLFRKVALKIAKKFPNIKFQEVNIDAMCMWLIKNPNDFDIIVAENLFGDILSDLSAQLVGGLGFAGSANLGDDFAIFEPCHGSAPKYTGMNKVNPIATFLSLQLMLDWLGEKKKGDVLFRSIQSTVKNAQIGTYDMNLNSSNIEVTDEICKNIKNYLS
tara:strand:+ start:4993 stop:6126 length:1134 start_codon:yes stop_codon:yes gene_type:complete